MDGGGGLFPLFIYLELQEEERPVSLLKCGTRPTICRHVGCCGIGLFARWAAGSGAFEGGECHLWARHGEMPARPRAFTNGQRETMELQSWWGQGRWEENDEKATEPRDKKAYWWCSAGELTWPPRIRSNNVQSPNSSGIWQPRTLHVVYLSAIMSMTVMICWEDVAAQHEFSARCQTDGYKNTSTVRVSVSRQRESYSPSKSENTSCNYGRQTTINIGLVCCVYAC